MKKKSLQSSVEIYFIRNNCTPQYSSIIEQLGGMNVYLFTFIYIILEKENLQTDNEMALNKGFKVKKSHTLKPNPPLSKQLNEKLPMCRTETELHVQSPHLLNR